MLWSAFVIGFVGSLHCIGMCGPIILAMPVHTGEPVERIIRSIIYHGGRASTYAILGSVIGLAGGAFLIIGHQQTISIVIGVLIILAAITPKKLMTKVDPTVCLGRLNIKIHSRLANWFKGRTIGSTLVMGMLNGILPCGLVYVALAGALASGNSLTAASYMLVFGLGTFPALLLVHLTGDLLSIGIRNKLLKLMPAVYVVLGLLFILRGLDLGIPFLSPEFGNDGSTIDCH